MTDQNDLELVRGCIEGDETAWSTLVDRYAQWVASVVDQNLAIAGFPPNSGDREELVAAVFARLWENDRKLLRRYNPAYSLATWLRVITVSTVRNALHARFGLPSLPDALLKNPDFPSELDRAVGKERVAQVQDALNRLSARDRLLLELHDVQKLSYDRIARFLHLSPNSIGPLLARARQRLADALPNHPD